MNGINGVLIIGIGLFLLYLGFTGKLDCIISVFKTCASADSSQDGAREGTDTPENGAFGELSAKLKLKSILIK